MNGRERTYKKSPNYIRFGIIDSPIFGIDIFEGGREILRPREVGCQRETAALIK